MKIQSLVLPLLLLGVVLAAIESESITARHDPPGPVHVTYWEKWTGFEADAMRAVVDDYNRSQNKIHVDFLTVSDILNKTLLATAGGNPPDVAGLQSVMVPQYADDEALMPLDDYCREAGIKRKDFVPLYWDMNFYKGHVYGLTSTPATTALHYNLTMLKEAGYDHPPKTIEELDAMAAAMFKRGPNGIERAGFFPSEPGWWGWGWGMVFGGRLWDGKSKLTANDPLNVKALEWVRNYSQKYGASQLQSFKSGFGNFSSPQNAFISQKVAMELQGVWMHNFIEKFSPDMKWGAVPFPYPKDRPDLANTTFVDNDVLCIPRGARHPKEAFEFVKYVMSQPAMEKLCLGQRKQSALAKVSDEFWRRHPNPYIRLFAEIARSKNALTPPPLGIWPEYESELNEAYQEVALLKKTPQEALDDVQARMGPKAQQYLERLQLRDKAR